MYNVSWKSAEVYLNPNKTRSVYVKLKLRSRASEEIFDTVSVRYVNGAPLHVARQTRSWFDVVIIGTDLSHVLQFMLYLSVCVLHITYLLLPRLCHLNFGNVDQRLSLNKCWFVVTLPIHKKNAAIDVCLFVRSFVCSFIRSLARSIARTFSLSFVCSFVWLFSQKKNYHFVQWPN